MTISAQQLLDEARLTIPECSPEEVRAAVNSAEPPLLVDVRETSEWDSGRVPGAVHIPRGLLEWKADPGYANHDPHLAGQNDARIVVMCASGGRSLLAAKTLREMGYRRTGCSRSANCTEMPDQVRVFTREGPRCSRSLPVRYSRTPTCR